MGVTAKLCQLMSKNLWHRLVTPPLNAVTSALIHPVSIRALVVSREMAIVVEPIVLVRKHSPHIIATGLFHDECGDLFDPAQRHEPRNSSLQVRSQDIREGNGRGLKKPAVEIPVGEVL